MRSGVIQASEPASQPSEQHNQLRSKPMSTVTSSNAGAESAADAIAQTGPGAENSPDPNNPHTLEVLTASWTAAKQALTNAQENLLKVEVAIWNAVKDRLPDKGT